MFARHASRSALLAALALAGCGNPASGVELRLYPCSLPGDPSSVGVTIQSYDGGGAAIGDRLEKSFAIGDPAVFSDGYATAEFIPPAGTATADFTVTWSAGGVESVAVYERVAVPKAGGAIVLGNDACESPEMTTGPASTGETTGEDTTGTGTGTGTTGSTSTGSTSDGTTTSPGTTWESTSDASTSSGSSSTTGGTTGGPQEGDPCDAPGTLICDGGPGVLGQFLLCDVDTMKWKASAPQCDVENACPPELGLANPQLVGCLGDGETWTCACADIDMMTMLPKECPPDGVSKCGDPLGRSVEVELCVSDGQKLLHYVGICPKCVEDVPGEPLCAPQ